ncbi:hypothetical protein TNCV_2811111 [Trichonephila clavipes]|nr:hypothetical protein TNCV_2811111 [Trichonephila clavipes]
MATHSTRSYSSSPIQHRHSIHDSCAAYVVEYVNKANRGINKLQRQIIKIMYQHPDFDIIEITRKMSIDMINKLIERQRIRRTRKELEEMNSVKMNQRISGRRIGSISMRRDQKK